MAGLSAVFAEAQQEPPPVPFPKVERMNQTQRDAMTELAKAATQASAKATVPLLQHLDSRSFRSTLRRCSKR